MVNSLCIIPLARIRAEACPISLTSWLPLTFLQFKESRKLPQTGFWPRPMNPFQVQDLKFWACMKIWIRTIAVYGNGCNLTVNGECEIIRKANWEHAFENPSVQDRVVIKLPKRCWNKFVRGNLIKNEGGGRNILFQIQLQLLRDKQPVSCFQRWKSLKNFCTCTQQLPTKCVCLAWYNTPAPAGLLKALAELLPHTLLPFPAQGLWRCCGWPLSRAPGPDIS